MQFALLNTIRGTETNPQVLWPWATATLAASPVLVMFAGWWVYIFELVLPFWAAAVPPRLSSAQFAPRNFRITVYVCLKE